MTKPIKFKVGGAKRKLSDAQVHEARKMYNEGSTAMEIAIKFGLSHAAIYDVLGGRRAYEGV